MTPWRALVPIKAARERKTRLAHDLSSDERVRLSDAMLWHVLGVLRDADCISEVALLSTAPIAGWDGQRLVDEGRGLNAELQAAAATIDGLLLVIHADLPSLSVEDVTALTLAGRGGIAIAPDRHHRGTNAIALGRRDGFIFAFGADSLDRHRSQTTAPAIIDRPGLALDIDVMDDLDLLAGAGSWWREDMLPGPGR